ncbi:hypothetical protein FALCPG4_18957 [Fusarium falciforme]
MGVHKEKTIRSYWKPPKPGDQRPAHSFIKFMPYNKFQLLHRHLRPFDHTKYDETAPIPKVFQCVEEWSDHIQAVSMQIFRPGSHLAVDECTIRYTGKSDDITVIKGKPDPVGFKICAIAQCGFFIRWIWHIKEKPHGAAGVEISTQESSSQGRSSKRRKSQSNPLIQKTSLSCRIRLRLSLLPLQICCQKRHITSLWITSSRRLPSSATSATTASGPQARLARIAVSIMNSYKIRAMTAKSRKCQPNRLERQQACVIFDHRVHWCRR